MHYFHLLLHGRVQGVGYRAFAQRRAIEYGVLGEVRNTPDGGVEVIAEGDPTSVESFLAEVRRGPMLARIEHEELRRGEAERRFRRFTITG